MPDGLDRSGGWEAVAETFIRQRSNIGVGTVQTWARSLPAGATVVDLGCGSGVPISQALIEAGHTVYGMDASPSMVAAFRRRFPELPVACEPVEQSSFFGRTFDGAIAWGLIFLLPEETQRAILHRVAQALTTGGRLLFTAPSQRYSWVDLSTGRRSQSLGADGYRAALADAGFVLAREYHDEGENHYYEAVKQ